MNWIKHEKGIRSLKGIRNIGVHNRNKSAKAIEQEEKTRLKSSENCPLIPAFRKRPEMSVYD